MSRNYFLIFSDGACSGNPGPGGWGAVVLSPEDEVTELGDFDPTTTNNRMEMMAAIRSLEFISSREEPVRFYTDSTYLIRGITQWIWGWLRRGWKTADGQEVQNKDLWQKLHQVVQNRSVRGKIEWHYTRGHIGTPGNERCDSIAVAFSKGDSINLYRGAFETYSVDLFHLPEDTSLPEMKPAGEKKVAFSYLSNLGGLVYRHRDWPSCQKRVSGQSGAKFKKAMSPADEKEILKGWGLSENTAISEA